MADKATEKKVDASKDKQAKSVDPSKKLDLGLLEEDDEFEEFPVEDWPEKEVHEDEGDEEVNVWEDNWDDDTVEDDFSKQLRSVLEQHKVVKR